MRLPRWLAQPINRAALPVVGVPSVAFKGEVTTEALEVVATEPGGTINDGGALYWDAREAFHQCDLDAYGDPSFWRSWQARVLHVQYEVQVDPYSKLNQKVVVVLVQRPSVAPTYTDMPRWDKRLRNVLAGEIVRYWNRGQPL